MSTKEETRAGNPVFDMRTAGEWLDEAKVLPVPKKLFGELWLEGELAMLFGDAGSGKSVLAVQMAENITSGARLSPFETAVRPQPIIYLDLQSSEKQFEMRYAADHDEEEGDFLKNHFPFSVDFHRVQIDPFAALPEGSGPLHELVYEGVKAAVAKTGARILIVDSITQLKRSNDVARDMLPMMRQLRRLKNELSLSVLVLAQTPRREAVRPLSLGDLQGAKLLANFADSIFAIGRSGTSPAARYIKHIESRSTELFYGAPHVPSLRIEKISGNFLGFVFDSVTTESYHMRDMGDRRDWATIDKIKEMSDSGMPVRDIAADLNIPKTTVGRLKHLWVPPPETAQAAATEPEVDPFYFPGCEEYDAEKASERYEGLYSPENAEKHYLRREYRLIEQARADAHREYRETGTAPTLQEMINRYSEKDAREHGYDEDGIFVGIGASPSSVFGSETNGTEENGYQSDQWIGDNENSSGDLPLSTFNDSTAQFNSPKSGLTEVPKLPASRPPGLKRSYDNASHEIFIELEDERGRPKVWLKVDKKAQWRRLTRSSTGITSEPIETPPWAETRQ